MRLLSLIAVFVAVPVATMAQNTAPTKAQKEYFARQLALFERHLINRANSDAYIECDSVLPQDCLELAARSANRREILLLRHRYEECAPLSDMKKLICLNDVSARRAKQMGEWEREWRQRRYQ